MDLFDDKNIFKETARIDELIKQLEDPPLDLEALQSEAKSAEAILEPLLEKQLFETLNEEELALLDRWEKQLSESLQNIRKVKYLIGLRMYRNAMVVMEEYRKAGAAGNADAQKSYEKLYQRWLIGKRPDSTQFN